MKRFLIPTLLSVMIAVNTQAQSNPLDKKLDKAYELIKKDKYDDAEKYVAKIVQENPDYNDGWDLLCKIRYQQYENATKLDGMFGNIKVSTKDASGKDVPASDSLQHAMEEVFSSFKPSDNSLYRFYYTMRKALLVAEDPQTAGVYLRMLKIDKEVDTNVNKKALKYFSDGEAEFEKRNMNAAAKLYKRALEIQPDFYKANLYLGDCFYMQEDYPDAAEAFKDVISKYPDMVEPRKYLTDAYLKSRMYEKALNECVGALMVYPDPTMRERLESAVYMLNKKIAISWMPRGVFPNRVDDSVKEKKMPTHIEGEPAMKPAGPWVYYKNALKKAEPYCNSKGIMSHANNLTSSKYLEVYSWEEMLKNSTDPSLELARNMQRDGYLDCYVLVTLFHYDFYDQYLDFVKKNKEKVTAYYKRYITNM